MRSDDLYRYALDMKSGDPDEFESDDDRPGKYHHIIYKAHFEDVSAQSGVVFQHVSGRPDVKDYIFETKGGGIGAFDFDNDGWLDLFVLSGTRFNLAPQPSNRLYRNTGGRFVDVSQAAGIFGFFVAGPLAETFEPRVLVTGASSGIGEATALACVQAGAAAGMTVFGFAAMTDAGALQAVGAVHVFARMDALPELLARAGSVSRAGIAPRPAAAP